MDRYQNEFEFDILDFDYFLYFVSKCIVFVGRSKMVKMGYVSSFYRDDRRP